MGQPVKQCAEGRIGVHENIILKDLTVSSTHTKVILIGSVSVNTNKWKEKLYEQFKIVLNCILKAMLKVKFLSLIFDHQYK